MAVARAAAERRRSIRAIVPNRSARLIALLDRTRGWRRVRSDKVGAIYVRDAA